MAAKKTAEAENTAAAVESAEKAEAVKTEPKFATGKLREKCMALYGVSQSTFDGAMYGHTAEEYTVKEAGAIIDGWLHGKGGKE